MSLSEKVWMGGAWCGLVLAGLLTGGCKTTPAGAGFTEMPGVTAELAMAEPAAAGSPAAGTGTNLVAASMPPVSPLEVLQANDAIRISFTDLPTPQPIFDDRIKADGTIRLMLDQTFVATNKTRGELEKEIRDRYVPKYYKFMTVQVIFQEQMRFYFVGGEVRSPGRQVYLGSMTVLKAIQSCGDFTDFAKKKAVELTRADGRMYKIDCKKAQQDPSLDLDVYPGDRIRVPRKLF